MHLGGRGKQVSEFRASLDYRVSFMTARATQRILVSKNICMCVSVYIHVLCMCVCVHVHMCVLKPRRVKLLKFELIPATC